MPDIVYVLRPADRNEQLRYSLRSVAAHLPHGRVWLAGHCPSWVRDVGCIPVVQQGTKYQNSTANLKAAAEHPDVADEFLLMNDDFFIMRPVERMPVLHRGPVSKVEGYYARRASGMYLRGMRETRELLAELGFPAPLSYELHVPMPMDKTGLLHALEAGQHLEVLHKRTLYGALHGLGGHEIPDPKVLGRGGQFAREAPFLSTMPDSFSGGLVGEFIRGRFPSLSVYEQTGR